MAACRVCFRDVQFRQAMVTEQDMVIIFDMRQRFRCTRDKRIHVIRMVVKRCNHLQTDGEVVPGDNSFRFLHGGRHGAVGIMGI